jgi:tyrosyl-tRNA synthetase
MTFSDVIKLASKYTVAQILERDDFEKRMESKTPISLHELLYPLSQAMDSVAVTSDVELGGTDQKFNLLVGRAIQESYGQNAQCIVTCELLEGTDGVEKMSKSLNNAICFTDAPKDIFGKTMSIPDKLIFKYFTLTTMLINKELAEIKAQLDDPATNPRNIKVRLGYELVKKYYDEESAKFAQKEFETIFVKKEVPDDIPEFKMDAKEVKLVTLMKENDMASSSSEAIRLIKAGGVTIDGEKITDEKYLVKPEKDFILKVGKRRFLKVLV